MKTGLLLSAFSAIATISYAQTVELNSPEFNDAVRNYLLENPEVIFEAVEIYNLRQAENEQAAVQKALEDNQAMLYDESLAITMGNPEGTFTIVEFLDYNCGYCRKSHAEFDTVLEANPDLKILLRQFPILSKDSLDASRVVLAVKNVYGNDEALMLNDYLYDEAQGANLEVALGFVEDQGWDRAKVEAALEDEAVYENIAATQKIAEELQITGTPGFIVGDELLRGYVPADQMNQIIENKKSSS